MFAVRVPARLTGPAREMVFFSGERLEDLNGGGGCGRVRELLERGDRTPAGGFVVPGTAAFRPVGRVRVALVFAVTVVAGMGVALVRFLGLGSSSFSLSAPSDDNVEISSLSTGRQSCVGLYMLEYISTDLLRFAACGCLVGATGKAMGGGGDGAGLDLASCSRTNSAMFRFRSD